jgi:hypothetical protein
MTIEMRNYVAALAVFLREHRKVMSGKELAEHLNRNGFQTSYGTPYWGGRGTYNMVRCMYVWLEKDGRLAEASAVAQAFVTPEGGYAYEVGDEHEVEAA